MGTVSSIYAHRVKRAANDERVFMWKLCAIDGEPTENGCYIVFLTDDAGGNPSTAIMDWDVERKTFVLSFPQAIAEGVGVIAFHQIESPLMIAERATAN